MRFDIDRAMAHIRALDDARPAGSEAERRAADDVAERLQGAGLSVERREAAGRALAGRIATPVVIGTRPTTEEARARLVILTHLETSPEPWSLRGLLAGRRHGRRDDGSGLALLIELARAWPVPAKEELAIAFAAVGAGAAGARELARIVAEEWPRRPTLVIHIQSPGYGNQLVLGGSQGPLRLAQVAARDLWIPHREGGRWPTPRGLRPFARRGIDAVRLTGAIDPSKPRPKPDELFQPAMLGTTAQLVRELALRWRRRQEDGDHPRAPRTAARSDQKPG
jgi:hypothetical protein